MEWVSFYLRDAILPGEQDLSGQVFPAWAKLAFPDIISFGG